MKHCDIYFEFDYADLYKDLIQVAVEDGETDDAKDMRAELARLKELDTKGVKIKTLKDLDDVLNFLCGTCQFSASYNGRDIWVED